ncbi:trypco2 family protein [Streptomyces sp. NPDC000983]|uniref:trypco2 family protein n=1 Tax=Streptomyces sp. NPDC000983 TaxID=3154373 RepID=UPI0033272738
MDRVDTPDGIELADAIEVVRDQLMLATARGNGQDVRFEVGDIHMEFTVELRTEATTGAKVRAWVVDAGADGTRARTRTHRVAFTLTPKDTRTGGSVEVGNPDQGGTGRFGRGTTS